MSQLPSTETPQWLRDQVRDLLRTSREAVLTERLEASIDPAEHAAHAIIDAHGTLDKELMASGSFARALAVKEHIARAFRLLDALDLKASDVLSALSHKKGAA